MASADEDRFPTETFQAVTLSTEPWKESCRCSEQEQRPIRGLTEKQFEKTLAGRVGSDDIECPQLNLARTWLSSFLLLSKRKQRRSKDGDVLWVATDRRQARGGDSLSVVFNTSSLVSLALSHVPAKTKRERHGKREMRAKGCNAAPAEKKINQGCIKLMAPSQNVYMGFRP